ncbi:MAG TPA: FG-GAP-like repeat-containing protein [Thermoleophilaceae bacterium]
MSSRGLRAGLAAATAALVAAAVPAAAAVDHGFPGTDPNESVRIHTPNDHDFDHCEIDDQDGQDCGSLFEETFARFGFAPAATQDSAVYHNPLDAHVQRLSAQNTLAGRHPLGQVGGVSADRAWKYTTGDPRVKIAIVDTGAKWENPQLRLRLALNKGELRKPRHADATDCADYDCDGNGAFNVDDYAQDPGVAKTAGNNRSDAILDGSDLIAALSDGRDDDRNGYTDDIAGWDYLDDDNDPFDQSSYSSAHFHGNGRAEEAVAEGNDDGINGDGGDIGLCPRCQFVPLRDWDSFVADTNRFAQAVGYAADNHIQVVEGAIGGMFNSRFAQRAFDYAYRRGVFLAIVSSDINSANHNIPTVYDEATMISGTVTDNEGLGHDFGGPQEVYDFFGGQGINLTQNVPVGTYFRNSGTTQYGGHAHVVFPAVTGSVATGQASGAAGLIISEGLKKGMTLDPNEVKQILTGAAEDVVPENTGGSGVPDPAQTGWDQHFGYGRPDLGLALERVAAGRIPPRVLIDSPDWFAPLDVTRRSSVEVGARLSAPRAAGYNWKLEYAPGIEPCEQDFVPVASGSGTAPRQGALGTIDLLTVRKKLDDRHASSPCGNPGPVTGGSTPDPTAPSKGPGDVDPNEPAFTVRVVVTDTANNRAEDRKTLFAYRDTTAHPGWSKNLGTGGEASPRMFDVDGDNRLDTIVADSSGGLNAYRADGSPVPSFAGGHGVVTRPYSTHHPGEPIDAVVDPPREILRTPVIGDIDGDGESEIVDSAGEHVYAWHLDGSEVDGFPVSLDPSFSGGAVENEQNHVKRGFMASPTLADLDGDGRLEVAVAGMDQHLYVWNGNGDAPAGFPLKLKKPGEATNATTPGAESINTAAAGDLSGDGRPDLVVATNEAEGGGAGNPFGIPDLSGAAGRVYAVDGKGKFLPGWPMEPSALLPNLLPFVGPGEDHSLADVDGDGKLDVIGNIATGQLHAFHADGTSFVDYDQEPQTGETVDRSFVANAFDYPVLGDLDGLPGPEVAKAGLTLQGAANLLLVGQNQPFNHVVQAWNASTGQELPTYPQAIEDYLLLTEPAVSDVAASAGNEVVVGTGLYMLRAIDGQGVEDRAGGWPKFTGGWLQATAAFGDADGDGKLEVTALTREGNAFLWDTDRGACGTNDQWWTSHHDEHNTSRYGADTRPPGTPGALTATRTGGKIVLSWVAPGDDWLCGNAKAFRVLGSNGALDSPRQGSTVDRGAAASVGKPEQRSIDDSAGRRTLAVQYQDDAGNWGHVASLPVPRREGETTFSQQGGTFGVTGVGAGEGPGGLRPVVKLKAPAYASNVSRTRRFTVSWTGSAPTGIGWFTLQARTGGSGWRTVVRRKLTRSVSFTGRAGRTYEFRVQALSRGGVLSRYVKDRTVVPLDERSRRLGFSRGWTRRASRSAYGRTLTVTSRRGAGFRYRFRGTRFAVIAPRSRSAGRLRIVVDGRRRTVSLRGRPGARRAVFHTGRLRRGRHRVSVRSLGHGPVAIDALGLTG